MSIPVTHSIKHVQVAFVKTIRVIMQTCIAYYMYLTLKVLVATIDAQWEGMGM